MWVFLLIPLLLLHGCAPNRSDYDLQRQSFEKRHAEARAKDDKTRAEYVAKATRIEEAIQSTKVPESSLTSPEDVQQHSANVGALLALISETEKDPRIQSPRSVWRPYVEPSLTRGREAVAAGMITKAKAQLQMKDFDGARATLRQVLVAFDPRAYGPYTRQAEFILQDVEKAAAIANK